VLRAAVLAAIAIVLQGCAFAGSTSLGSGAPRTAR